MDLAEYLSENKGFNIGQKDIDSLADLIIEKNKQSIRKVDLEVVVSAMHFLIQRYSDVPNVNIILKECIKIMETLVKVCGDSEIIDTESFIAIMVYKLGNSENFKFKRYFLESMNINLYDVYSIANCLSKLNKFEFLPKNKSDIVKIKYKLVNDVNLDQRAIVLRLSELVYETNIDGFNDNQNVRFYRASENLKIFAPVAERMGLNKLKNELEECAFKLINYRAYKNIANKKIEIIRDHGVLLEEFKSDLYEIVGRISESATLFFREKTCYSTYKKMIRKEIDLDGINDIFGFRIVCDKIEDCYKILNILNQKYSSSLRSHDYIKIPKNNGYKSIHQILLFNSTKLEVQIKTIQMHLEAEYGMHSHWKYKYQNSINSFKDWIIYVLDELALDLENMKYQCFDLKELEKDCVMKYVDSESMNIFYIPKHHAQEEQYSI